jgi:hypothetical protein
MRRLPSAYFLLTKLFLRQFLENDLVNPDGDRSQMLAIVGASVISLTLFIGMFMSAGYAMQISMPGQAAILTLSDKFFYCALAMLIPALVAASNWDALALDQRDAVILQPLPVRPAALRLAKLTAIAMLGAGVSLAVNIFPTFIFPWMLAFSVPQMAATQLFGLMATHFLVTVTAAVFGYLVIIAIRESSSAVLGRWFPRVSPWLQTATIMVLACSLLLLPVVTARAGQRGFSGWRLALPPTAFVGVYEQAGGAFIADLPRPRMTPRQATLDRAMTALYEQRRALFPMLARRAELMFLSVAAVVALATGINAFRMPAITIAAAGRRRRSRLAALTPLLFPRSSASRAGFDFAVATLWRSKPHRLTLTCAAAIGFAVVLIALAGVDLAGTAVTPRLLVAQPFLYGCLLVGFRHVVRVPAELRANWAIQAAWRGHARGFANGVQLAGLLTLALPAVIAAMVPVTVVGGVGTAAAHAMLGMIGAALVLDALMLSYDKVPFACTYLAGDNGRALVPIFALAFLIGANVFARVELAILTGGDAAAWTAALVAVLIVLRVISSRRPRVSQVDFNETAFSLSELKLHG